jgi:tetratricopeptide (TPR) repeat protein
MNGVVYKKKHILAIYLFLTAISIVAFWQVKQCDFINFDDPIYVTENIHIRYGMTMEAIRWAFTTGHAGYWIPVTWMSHMLDVQLFGLNPRWHHLTNLLFHIANTLLLFFVFHRMTKAPWKSAFVAALFAVHPLHVESVAWVAERKDVLSTFFWMLTIGAYIHYVEHPRLKNYVVVITLFALGLMAKPMLVTLPFVLLLLDYWPLKRFEELDAGKRREGDATTNVNSSGDFDPLPVNKRGRKSGKKHTGQALSQSSFHPRVAILRHLVLEKLPLFTLTVLSSIATFVAQGKVGAVVSSGKLPPGVRIINALVSYIIYIRKTIWPSNLAVFYPHLGLRPVGQVLVAVLALIVVTFIVIWSAKRHPYLALGWLWFTGTLVPVIGIAQAGNQSMSDRFTYIPLIGLFVMVAWGIPELVKKWRYHEAILFASSALVLISLFIATRIQVAYWNNDIALYDHALKVTGPNDIILNNRGAAYGKLGNYRQAISDYDQAIGIDPDYAMAYYNRGVAYAELGSHRQAIEDFDRAIGIDPKRSEAYYNRGLEYGKLDNQGQAIEDYNRAVEINPKYAEAYNNRGFAYYKLGNRTQAISDFDKAVEINPEYADAYYKRGVVYGELGNLSQAISDYDRAIEINPQYALAFHNRGFAYARLGNLTQAIEDFDRAIELDPEYAKAYYNRGIANGMLGNRNQAIEDLMRAARLDNENAKNFLRSKGMSW